MTTNIFTLLVRAAEHSPTQTSWQDSRIALTYGELLNNVTQTREQLVQYNVTGEVAIYIENSVEFVVALFACISAGLAPLLINARFPQAVVENMLETYGINTVLFKQGSDNLNGIKVKSIAVEASNQQLSPVRTPHVVHNNIAFKLHTSGTTGTPKLKAYDHRLAIASIERMDWGWPANKGEEVWLAIAPFSHIYGLLMGVLNPLYSISHTIAESHFNPAEIVRKMRDSRITIFGGGPPSIYFALLREEGLAEACQGVRMFPGGGALFSSGLIEEWKAITGKFIRVGYGMTELAPLAVNVSECETDGCVGLPPPGVEVLINEAKPEIINGNEHAVGEVYVREQADSETLVYMPTGDVGYIEDDGNIALLGRCKDVIIVNGFNVYPQHVEAVLNEIENVKQSCVVGVPSCKTGEKIIAYLVLLPGMEMSIDNVRQYCCDNLPYYAVPADYIVVESIPLTPSGKPDKLKLIQLAT